jgi:hypothetical protein
MLNELSTGPTLRFLPLLKNVTFGGGQIYLPNPLLRLPFNPVILGAKDKAEKA